MFLSRRNSSTDRFQERTNFRLPLCRKLFGVDYSVSLLFIAKAVRWGSIERCLRAIP